MRSGVTLRVAVAAVAAACVLAAPAGATNGMYLAGYGSEAAGRAGANLGVADRAMGLQANPAGIAQLQGQHLSIDLQLLAPKLRYSGDPAGNAIDGENALFAMPSLTWVRGTPESPWNFGLALISQGGMGAHFIGYRTPFGTTDETFSEVRFLTATPTASYAITPDLALGVSGNLGYSDVRFRFFPNTSFYNDGGTPTNPADDMGFFGANMVGRAKSMNASGRVGVMWRALPQLQLGAVYQTETTGSYKNGKLQLNETAVGLGLVNYEAEVDGFSWPEQFGVGAQVHPLDRLMVALDARLYRWSGAMARIDVKGSSPDKASPLTNPLMPFVFDWKDQWVYIAGLEYRATRDLTLRTGFNFGADPVPATTLNPLFPAITEKHATAGFSYTLQATTLNLAVERAFSSSVTNTNADPNVNPFGPGAAVDHSQWTVSLGVSRAFSGR